MFLSNFDSSSTEGMRTDFQAFLQHKTATHDFGIDIKFCHQERSLQIYYFEALFVMHVPAAECGKQRSNLTTISINRTFCDGTSSTGSIGIEGARDANRSL